LFDLADQVGTVNLEETPWVSIRGDEKSVSQIQIHP
jgi:hypothetical protein